MAVLQVNRLEDGRSGPEWSSDGTRVYHEPWEAICDTVDDNPLTILGNLGLPQRFISTHPKDPYAICIDAKVESQESEYWKLAYTFSTRVPQFAQGKPDGSNQGQPQFPDNPLDRKPEISVSTQMIKVHTLVDLDGRDYLNAAGFPFETKLQEVPVTVFDVEKNIGPFDPNVVKAYANACNANVFLGYARRQVKCESLSLHGDWNPTFHWKARGRFIIGNDDQVPPRARRPSQGNDLVLAIDGHWWFDFRLNAGFDELVNNVRTPILLAGGQRPARPVPLDLFGGKLAVGQDPIYFGFRQCRDFPLEALPLFV